MVQVLVMGEVMVELSQVAGAENRDLRRLNFAGDTFNTAIYLARLGTRVGYYSRLSDDPYSARIRAMMDSEGVDHTGVETAPGRTPGLYMITNTEAGERTFCYWRGQSPARDMLDDEQKMQAFARALAAVPYLYLSGITLGIITADALQRLFSVLQDYRRQGGQVVFDSNYRPQLWQNADVARAAMSEALSHTDIALLTDTDEQTLWGSDSTDEIRLRCQGLGVRELVIKRGAQPVYLALADNQGDLQALDQVPVPPVPAVVDTTAAGDSFNAAYLTERIRGEAPHRAAQAGIRCAAVVIAHCGAIIDRTYMDAVLA